MENCQHEKVTNRYNILQKTLISKYSLPTTEHDDK